jgi:hypothetical protein
MENGADLPTVQALLGHTDLKPTSIYLHLSERHLKAAGTPLDKAVLSPMDQVKRSRQLHKKPAGNRLVPRRRSAQGDSTADDAMKKLNLDQGRISRRGCAPGRRAPERNWGRA